MKHNWIREKESKKVKNYSHIIPVGFLPEILDFAQIESTSSNMKGVLSLLFPLYIRPGGHAT